MVAVALEPEEREQLSRWLIGICNEWSDALAFWDDADPADERRLRLKLERASLGAEQLDDPTVPVGTAELEGWLRIIAGFPMPVGRPGEFEALALRLRTRAKWAKGRATEVAS